MTDEATVTFVREGFEVVTQQKDADYTLDVTMTSCSPAKMYKEHRKEIPIEERPLFKDFKRWVEEGDSDEIITDAKEIAELIRQNKPEGFKRFYADRYIERFGQSFDYTENWGIGHIWTVGYLKQTKGVVLPAKYYGMKDEEKKILTKAWETMEEGRIVEVSHTAKSADMIGAGARMSSIAGTGNL